MNTLTRRLAVLRTSCRIPAQRIQPRRLAFVALLTLSCVGKGPVLAGAELGLDLLPNTFPDPSSVRVSIDPILGNPVADQSSLGGSGSLVLAQDQAPYGTAQITDLLLELRDGMSFNLLVLGQTLSAVAEPGAVGVRLVEPGAAGNVVGNQFDQLGNLFQFEGEIILSTQPTPYDLSSVAPVSADVLGIRLSEAAGQISASAPIDLLFDVEIPTLLGPFPIQIEIVGGLLGVAPKGTLGDLDGDGVLGGSDIDLLYAAIRAGSQDPAFDLNGDQSVDRGDTDFLVSDLLNTYYGDADLDSEFNSADLVAMFQLGQYEDAIALNSTWATGDWDGDLEFSSGDFVKAFQDGGFELGPKPAAQVIPEPRSGLIMASFAIYAVLLCRAELSRHNKFCGPGP